VDNITDLIFPYNIGLR